MTETPAARLFLLRHAHSSLALPGQRDHQRGLEERGRAEARSLAPLISAAGYSFDGVVSSTARRATETLDELRLAPAVTGPIQRSGALYDAEVEAYFIEARRFSEARNLLLVGHNPTIEEFALLLAGSGEAGALALLRAGFPTCGLAVIEFPTGLGHIAPAAGRLVRLLLPGSEPVQ